MRIAKDTVVTLTYTVVDTEGNTVDEGRQPLTYLHGGYGGLFPRIETELNGKAVDEAAEIRLQPNEAFGDYDAELVSIAERDLFPENLEVGMQFERVANDDDEAAMLFTVTDIAEGKVVVDGNHPLAGMTLIFSCTITGIRAAGAEEIAHGHPHGPGQAHH